MNYKKLTNKARKLRQDTFLTFIEKGEAHLGGSFSMIETLLTLYKVIMKKEDKFIHFYGNHSQLLEKHGLSSRNILEKLKI